jgi:hypothetical protein
VGRFLKSSPSRPSLPVSSPVACGLAAVAPTHSPPFFFSINWSEPSGEADEDLLHYLWRVSFRNASSGVLFIVVSDKRFPETLILSKGLAMREDAEAAQAKRIAELEEACANLKIEKDIVAAGYRRLTDK